MPRRWLDPARYWPALTAATRHLDAPVGALHLGALRHNAQDMVRRAAGTPIRIASKSVRVRGVVEALLQQPGYRGVLAYTLAEALWLADTVDDIVVGYPTAERGGIRRLGTDPELASRITLMVDSPQQLDLIDDVLPPGQARGDPRVPRARRVVGRARARAPRRAPVARARPGRRGRARRVHRRGGPGSGSSA